MIGHILNFKVKFFDSKLPSFILSFLTHSEYLSQCIILLIFSVAYNKGYVLVLKLLPGFPPFPLPTTLTIISCICDLLVSQLPCLQVRAYHWPLLKTRFFLFVSCCCFYFTLGFCILTASAVLESGEWGGDADGWANSWQEGNLCSSDLESKLPGRKNREWWSCVEGLGIIVSVFWGSD